MSSSGKNDLQLVEKDSNQSRAKIEPPRPRVPLGMTRKELIVVHLTAGKVASCGIHFEQELMRSVSSMNPEFQSLFQFLNPTDSRRGFFDEVTLVYVYSYTRSSPSYYSEYTSGYPSIGIELLIEVFLNGVRLLLGLVEEEGGTMDFPYLLEMEDCVDWPFRPVRCQHPTSPGPPDMEFSEGGLDACSDCEWYDWAEKQKEYNLQFPHDEEPIPMRIRLGESALDPQDQGLSTIDDDPDHSANPNEHVGAGKTLTNQPCERRLASQLVFFSIFVCFFAALIIFVLDFPKSFCL